MQRSKSMVKAIALLGFAGCLALCGLASPAAAQTYVCPPGYYFLAGYGCYPFGGNPRYFVPPPPPVYVYPTYPFAAPFGFGFRFGGPFHGGGHFHGGHGHR